MVGFHFFNELKHLLKKKKNIHYQKHLAHYKFSVKVSFNFYPFFYTYFAESEQLQMQ